MRAEKNWSTFAVDLHCHQEKSCQYIGQALLEGGTARDQRRDYERSYPVNWLSFSLCIGPTSVSHVGASLHVVC